MRTRVVVAMAVLAAAVAAGEARAGTELLVTGHGWGHGVGMSQWGAYGYAKHGWSYRRILFHYYPGTTLGHTKEVRVRVLLASGRKVVTVGCAASLRVGDGKRYFHKLPAATYGIGPRLVLPLHKDGSGRSLGRVAVFMCPRAPLTFDGRKYHGILVLRGNGKTVSVVNTLPLDTYVRGVVPSESPSTWPLAELEAQAVAARSYAVSELRPDAQYDLLPDARSQVYGGVRAETPKSDHAVLATLGQILTWDGQVARTYYSSSSGGRTEAVQDAWPGSSPIPYLRSVPDPYDTYSPLHTWGPYTFTPDRLAARLGLGGSLDSVQVERDASWRVTTVRFRLGSGEEVARSGESIERALHLRSTWFSIGELRLSASRTRVLYGRPVVLLARATGAKGAVLQRLNGDGWWHTVERLQRGRGALRVVPRANTVFRLHLPGTSGTSVRVAVAPRLRVRPVGPRLIAGTVEPRRAGPITVCRWRSGRWKLVARPRLGERGEFRTPVRLRPGRYRVAVHAGGSLASTQEHLHVTQRMLAALRQ